MNKRSLIYVNTAVLLFGLAGLFAKWIELPSIWISAGRVCFSSIALAVFMLIRKESFRVSKRDLILLLTAGAVFAFHWWSFLESIKRSTVAIGTITFVAFPLFVTILEPLVLKVRLTLMNILTAIMILIGVFITVPFSSVEGNIMAGALIGLCSSAAYAVLTLINKGLSAQNSATKVSFYEQATAAVILLPIALMQKTVIRPMDMGLLVVFGILTTALAHTLFVSGLKDIPAHLAGVFSSLETVYSIIFAFLILGEVPSLREVVGAFIIIAATMIASYAESRKRTV